MALWEIVFMLVILKIPVAYVGWVMWWSVKAEPEPGVEGGTEGIVWRPRRSRPPAGPGRSGRDSARGAAARGQRRVSRSRRGAGRTA